ncbi:metallophosphoesterase [Vibrio sp. MarTm2]|uniref:metallophosphoesterase family protein n=1 Tax=Vibrio sp. MarTm2 TaxID=2998831 RepID=UPI0022CD278D|nr:metallophosphoesterase [Vibrio sp. MarTm2]MDA0126465.1 metallophosphoesterase [Vibrio sp. MarTm2]
MSFLVVSDLHSTVKEEYKQDSRLIFDSVSNSSEHADAFIEYVTGLDQQIDHLVCPGDISNKGELQGFKAGWSFLNRVKTQIGAQNLLCVPGNHDHQSRPGKQFSAIHEIKFIEPSFPTDDFTSNTMFWGWHWLHQAFEDFNIIKLNSSAYHGLNDEYQHGRVAIETADQIYNYLKSGDKFDEKKFNILLCHHHPVHMEEVDHQFDKEVMEGGQYLLKRLDEANVGPWLVIHGHKHFASVCQGMTVRSTPPVIFSAGSLGANLYPEIKDRTENQFYILHVDLDKTYEEARLVGTFESHSWNLMRGWHPSQSDHLPHKGGFGGAITPQVLVRKIVKLLSLDPFLESKDLTELQNEIDYYTPGQFKELLETMTKEKIQFDCNGNKILQVANND